MNQPRRRIDQLIRLIQPLMLLEALPVAVAMQVLAVQVLAAAEPAVVVALEVVVVVVVRPFLVRGVISYHKFLLHRGQRIQYSEIVSNYECCSHFGNHGLFVVYHIYTSGLHVVLLLNK